MLSAPSTTFRAVRPPRRGMAVKMAPSVSTEAGVSRAVDGGGEGVDERRGRRWRVSATDPEGAVQASW